MHGISKDLLCSQAESIGIPLICINNSSNPSEYSVAIENQIHSFINEGITDTYFGDIFLEDLKNYRVQKCVSSGIESHFPLWEKNPNALIKEFVDLGFKAIITNINASILSETLLGSVIDKAFIENYPSDADICGENGEYHSFVFDGPIFHRPIEFSIRETLTSTDGSHMFKQLILS